jgi:cold shock CspA family protein
MGKSQETFGKKEVRKKNEKKRKDKEVKRAKKKSEGKSNFDDMIAYVDEFGMISSTPPDPDRKIAVSTESIELKVTKNTSQNTPDFVRKGVVTNFNKSKGYGFIRDMKSGLSIFVHINSMLEPVKENDVVIFELGKGAKGPSAMKVKLFKEEV